MHALSTHILFSLLYVKVVLQADEGSTGQSFRAQDVVDNRDGTYDVSYRVTAAGSYNLQISRNGEIMGGVTYPINVVAGDTHPSNTKVLLSTTRRLRTLLQTPSDSGPLDLSVDTVVSFSASLYDVYGNPTGSPSGNSASLKLLISAGTRQLASTGVWEWQSASPYNVFLFDWTPSEVTQELALSIRVNGEIAYSRVGTISGGEIDTANVQVESVAAVPGVPEPAVTAGSSNRVQIVAKDADGNILVGEPLVRLGFLCLFVVWQQ